MTWRQLLEQIQEMPLDHIDDNVTICVDEEFFGTPTQILGQSVDGDKADGVIDPGHFYIEI